MISPYFPLKHLLDGLLMSYPGISKPPAMVFKTRSFLNLGQTPKYKKFDIHLSEKLTPLVTDKAFIMLVTNQ